MNIMQGKHVANKYAKSSAKIGLIGMLVFQSTNALACCTSREVLDTEEAKRNAVDIQTNYQALKNIGCSDSDRTETSSCNGQLFTAWNNLRALVHTANALSDGEGATEFSLGLDAQGLADAYRWSAGEEFSSQETMSANFSNAQSNNVGSRINALRSGASGFSVNSVEGIASVGQPMRGMNAGDNTWSSLGGFINASYRYGNVDPSERENALDFDGIDVNAGLDYRLDDHWVAGLMLAYVTETVTFDASKSVVDGGIDMSGLSSTAFVLYQADTWYYSASMGYQSARFDTTRSIRYTSLNPDIASVNTTAVSSNDSSSLQANMVVGYSFQFKDRFTLEPSLGVNYQKLSIAAFREKDVNQDGFDLFVREQNFDALESVAALKLQYVMSSDYGVFTPYIDVKAITQFKTDARSIDAAYAAIADSVGSAADITMLTDELDKQQAVVSIGVASVLRGSSQKTLDAPATGGIQSFINYSEYLAAGNFHQSVISGGLRYEF
jgi:hypothetical protein